MARAATIVRVATVTAHAATIVRVRRRSVGVLLWEMLVGHRLFTRSDPDARPARGRGGRADLGLAEREPRLVADRGGGARRWRHRPGPAGPLPSNAPMVGLRAALTDFRLGERLKSRPDSSAAKEP